MPNDRSVQGHRHQIRQPTAAENARLVQLAHEIVAAHAAAEDYLIDLYERGVSQYAIAEILGITQGAVHLRILRRKRRDKQRRETGDEQRWFNQTALQPKVAPCSK